MDLAHGEQEAECERLARNLATLAPIDLKSAESWDLCLNGAEREIGRAAVAPLGERPMIAINMGGKASANDWGQANWRSLMARLADRFENFGLFSVGAAQDAERASDIGKLWRGPFVDLCGRLSPRQSAAALECAALFVGHDSGPIHLASAVGVSCVGLYGDHNPPRAWHPYFGEHRIIHDMRGIAHITVDEVEGAVEAFLVEAAGRKAG
jgi:ADP-heptose:LPS heptosyltransferase